MAALEEFVVLLKAQTGEFTSNIKGVSKDLNQMGSDGASNFSKLASVGKAALLGIGAAAVVVGAASVKLADSYESAHARLVTALKNTGTSFDAVKSKVDAAVVSGERFGYTATDTEGALATMTTGMGSVAKAAQYLALAQDLAAYKGISLSTAAMLVTRASEGQLRPLKQIGIDLPVAAGGALKTKTAFEALAKAQDKFKLVQEQIASGQLKGKAAMTAFASAAQSVTDKQQKLNDVSNSGQQILDALGKKLGGQAQAQAETFGGKLAALKAQLQDVGIKIGLVLIPILEKLASVTSTVITWLEKHQTAAKALAIVIGGALLVAVAAYTASMIQAAIATVAATWPILLVVAAIVALVAEVLFLWNNWDKIWNWISHHKALAAVLAPLILITAPIILIVGAIKELYDHWGTIWPAIQSIAETVSNALVATFGAIESAIGSVINVFEHFPERVSDALRQLITFIAGLPARVVTALISLGTDLIQAFSKAFLALAKNLPKIAEQVLEWFIALPVILVGKLIQFNILFDELFANAFIQLVKALPGIAATTLQWFVALPGVLTNAAINIGSDLFTLFAHAFSTLLGALPGLVAGIAQWFIALPGNIVGWIGDLGNLLYGAGQAIIGGLLRGIEDAVKGVLDFVSGIADKIKAHKGPPAYDKTVLIENGQLLMQGLEKGLKAEMPKVNAMLGDFTANIVSETRTPPASTFAAARNTQQPTGDTYFVINFDESGRAEVKRIQNYNRTHGPAPIKVTAG